MYIFICVGLYVYIYVCVYVLVCVYVCLYICVCVCGSINVFIFGVLWLYVTVFIFLIYLSLFTCQLLHQITPSDFTFSPLNCSQFLLNLHSISTQFPLNSSQFTILIRFHLDKTILLGYQNASLWVSRYQSEQEYLN